MPGDNTKRVLVVLGVHGRDCITIIVKHAVVADDGLFVNGQAVPVGTRDPHFEMPGFATCPGAQGMIKNWGYNACTEGPWGLSVKDDELRTVHPDSNFWQKIQYQDRTSGIQDGKLRTEPVPPETEGKAPPPETDSKTAATASGA